MASHSPHPNSLSPHSKQPISAFQWPIPPSPSHLKPANNQAMNDITVKEILERYNEDPELLKYILTAKSEEDKKKAAKDTLKAEEARIQLRHMDLELAREQSKASARFERPVYPPGYPHAYPHTIVPTTIHHQAHLISHPPPAPPPPPPPSHTHHAYPYYGLSPVQQQVLARFNNPSQHVAGQQQPPASPSMPYPHSAHPLCPPPADEKNFQSRLPQFRQPSPSSSSATSAANNTATTIAPISEDNRKRNRSSISSPNEIEQDKLSHNKVMEALKAKIQRGGGNGGPPSPLTASSIRPPPSTSTASPQSQDYPNKKKKPTLPRPVVVHQVEIASSPSPSPRSAKPVLPPIDTNLGRIDNSVATKSTPVKSRTAASTTTNNTTVNTTNITTTTTTTNTATSSSLMAKSDTDSSSSDTSGHSSIGHENFKKKTDCSHETKAGTDINNNSTASPSDHILLNTRRARSLSPPSSANTNTTSTKETQS